MLRHNWPSILGIYDNDLGRQSVTLTLTLSGKHKVLYVCVHVCVRACGCLCGACNGNSNFGIPQMIRISA